METMDWNRARAFLATAEAGSLSAAARALGLTQPTLSRQVAALEEELGLTLFERVGKRLVLTETGAELLAHARAMGEAAAELAFAATGRAEAAGGRVTISAADTYAAYLLPEIVARIRREAPEITVVVVSSNSLSDLRRREADVAIRHVRPEEEGLIGRLLCESTAHIYASEAWLERKGRPESIGAIESTDLLGLDDAERFAEFMRAVGARADADALRVLSSDSVVVWEMVKRGLGVSPMSREIAERTEGVVDLFPGFEVARFPIWLVTHRELRTSRRIRRVFEILTDELRRIHREPGAGRASRSAGYSPAL